MFKKGALKTTLAGFGGLFIGIATILKGDVATGVTSIITGVGLIFAKDFSNDKK
jgi:L-aminopeptidase/D-esterase-like protein